MAETLTNELISALWAQNPIFAAMGKKTVARCVEQYPAKVYKPQEVIIKGGAKCRHLYIQLSGTVRIFHESPDGRQVVVKLLRAPNVFAEFETFHELPMMESVSAVDEAVVARIPKSEYIDDLLAHNAQAAIAHLRHLTAAFSVAAKNEQLVFASLEQRVANLLLSYADYYGQDEEEGLLLAFSLSQNMIAHSLGTVRRSVAQVFSKWKKAEAVFNQDGFWMIAKPDVLEDLAAPIRGSLCYQMGAPLTRLAHRGKKTTVSLKLVKARGSRQGMEVAVENEVIIGCQPPSQLTLADGMASPQHCRVFHSATGARIWVEDFDSLNGTFVNEKQVRRAVLHDGDVIKVGGTQIKVRMKKG